MVNTQYKTISIKIDKDTIKWLSFEDFKDFCLKCRSVCYTSTTDHEFFESKGYTLYYSSDCAYYLKNARNVEINPTSWGDCGDAYFKHDEPSFMPTITILYEMVSKGIATIYEAKTIEPCNDLQCKFKVGFRFMYRNKLKL